uniref:Bm9730 n=1 Tax=Brugia malayi TaxID=6279 RepID=A0A0J9XUB3_BRUMA|nr:Bm9730 [Brugia malayi]
MSRRVSSSCSTMPTIFTDRWLSSNYLPCGILRFKNEEFLSSQVGEVNTEGNELKIGAIHVDSKGKKQFERRYVIPDNIMMECSETRISPDGILTITLFKKHLPS